jgi:xanthine dehydrogenase accessory factor
MRHGPHHSAQTSSSSAQIARLYGPAGLFIGSRAPAEIALSIAAQLVAVKNGLGGETLLDAGTGKNRLGFANNPLGRCTLN